MSYTVDEIKELIENEDITRTEDLLDYIDEDDIEEYAKNNLYLYDEKEAEKEFTPTNFTKIKLSNPFEQDLLEVILKLQLKYSHYDLLDKLEEISRE